MEDNRLPTSVTINDATLTCSTTAVSLTVQVDGVDSPYPVRWTGPASFTATGNPISVTAAGAYMATVAFPNGCTVVSAPNTGTVTQDDLTPPFVDAFGGIKTCPACSVTLVAEAENASFFWTGPNNFTSTSQFPVVQLEGVYTVTVTDLQSGCQALAEVVVEAAAPDPCPVLTIDTASLTICSGDLAPAITVTGSSFGPGQQVQFVQFTAPQSGTGIYTGGTILATVAPTVTGQAVLSAGILSAQLTSVTVPTLYIYAIVTPPPAFDQNGSPSCWPFALLTVTVSPQICLPISVSRIR